jgi:hypothetical protein
MITMHHVNRGPYRRICDACDGIIGKGEAAAEFTDGKHRFFKGPALLICQRCLQHPDDVDADLMQRADDTERRACERAEELRSFIGHLELPDPDVFQAEAELAAAKDRERLSRQPPAA